MTGANETYKLFAEFYDLYAGHYDTDLEFYQTYCDTSDRIIEIGCGTGRILEYMLDRGYRLTGVDISFEMLDKAKQKLDKWIESGDLSLLHHDFSVSPIETLFDKALVTFYTFNYILDTPYEFLKNIYESLKKDGWLLMDLFYPDSLYNRSIDDQWLEKEYTINGIRIRIRDKRKMSDHIENREQVFYVNDKTLHIKTDRRYYSPHELRDYLRKCGYIRIEFSPAFDPGSFCKNIHENELKNNYLVRAKK